MFNKYQTEYSEEYINNLPTEVKEQYYDFLTNVPYIRELTKVDRLYAKDLPRDDKGRIIVDITKPHILEDTNYFRPSAIHYKKYGCYTKLRPNSNPNSEYGKWIREEIRRCWEGYIRESDGEWIPGDLYFFLNYCPIQLIKKDENGKTIRTVDFPRFWDGHYYKSHYLYQCRESGHHAAELASRGRGKSFYAAAMLAKRFILGESKEVNKKVQCVATASERKYIQGANQLLDMFQYYIDFNANNTEFPRQRLTSSLLNLAWTMGYLDSETLTRRGTENSVIGITSKDDESKLRGSRGVLYLLEEAGCHLEGTKVLMANGQTKKVEDIEINDTLMGDDGTPRKVLELHSGVDDMYKITLSNGDTLIVNSKHLIYYKKYNWSTKQYTYHTGTPKEVLSIKNLNKGYYIMKSNKVEFKEKEIPFDPYWLGLWLGDGDKTRMAISNKDPEVLEWIRKYCNDNNYIYQDRLLSQSNNCYTINISAKNNVFNDFKSLGLINNKHIPDIFKFNSKEVLLLILAGIIDTDGNLNRKKQYYEITLVYKNKQIIDDVRYICHVLGFKTSITTRFNSNSSKSAGTLNYRLRISGDINTIPVKIKRKQIVKNHTYRNRLNWNDYTFKVEYYGKGKFYGFTVDKNNLFLLDDFTIVHNSFPRLLNLYQVLRPSVEDGNSVWGTIFLYGCCCAGTIVLKPNGEPIKIEDVSLGDKLLGYVGKESTIEDISWLQPIGYKQCVHITTQKANDLKCSTDHPILAVNKDSFGKSLGTCSFYRANELKVGDTLVMPKIVGKFGTIHEPHAFLLGALFGDGNYSNNSCVSLSISTEEEYNYYNDRYNIGISKFSKGNNLYAQIYFRKLHPLLKKYNMDKQSFERKTLPDTIFDWDRESVCLFLSGYFNADGNILIVKNKHRSIKLTCKYKNSLEQVKHLLMKLGISSHIYKEDKPSRVLHSNVNNKDYIIPETTCYVLYISNANDIITFKDNIKLLIKEKQDRLDSYTPSESPRIVDSLKFEMRDNGKGELLINKTIDNVQLVTIKSIEDIGIQRIYNMTANTTHTYISNGFISSNTAGDAESDFSSMLELMYNPKGYNIQSVPNVYDKEGQGRRDFTYFFPGYLNRDGCYDEDGNSDVVKALMEILKDRYTVKYNSSNINAITKRIAEIPITPLEAILKTHGNIFPITELTARLNEIDNNPNFYDDVYVGTLVMNKNGEVEFSISTSDRPIREFPTKDNKVTGALEVYEMPLKVNNKIPSERYIVSLDNYENDEAQTMSLGSMFVMDLWTDRIVAEYTGRPLFADDLNEMARKLCMFYNGKLMYENNKKNTFSYFSRMNSLHLLADTPEYLKNKLLIKFAGWGNTSKGITATMPIKNFAFGLIRDWLIKPVTVIKDTEDGPIEYTLPNLHFIKNRALLKELMLYNPAINVDRIMSLALLMLYREEKMILYQGDPTRNSTLNDKDDLSNDPFFTKNFKSKSVNLV